MFNLATGSSDPKSEAELGDGFLFRQGFTLAWLGWQFDVPENSDLLRLYAPSPEMAVTPIRGLMRAEYIPQQRVLSFSLADRTMIAYPVVNPEDPALQLTVRDRRDGPRQTIPREPVAVCPRSRGQSGPGSRQGFHGIRLRARQDLRTGVHRARPGPCRPRPCRGSRLHFVSEARRLGFGRDAAHLSEDAPRRFSQALGFGISQSGRFLRTFLYFGFNQDEEKPTGLRWDSCSCGRGGPREFQLSLRSSLPRRAPLHELLLSD